MISVGFNRHKVSFSFFYAFFFKILFKGRDEVDELRL